MRRSTSTCKCYITDGSISILLVLGIIMNYCRKTNQLQQNSQERPLKKVEYNKVYKYKKMEEKVLNLK